MNQDVRRFTTDLAVIGSGLAGCSASIFALNRGISTAQTGNTGAIAYTTGYFDLFGAQPGEKSRLLADPWQGLAELRTIQPTHPLARITDQEISAAFAQVTSFITEAGISYGTPNGGNLTAITPAGTSKPTFSVPATMQAGIVAYRQKSPCLILDFQGLRGFSSRQVVANLSRAWPSLRAARLAFPGVGGGEIYPEVMARSLEVPATQEELAARIREVLGDAETVGMPAIMGIHNPDKVMARLTELIGKPLFEIPTMPPSVPGIRLREMFEQVFPQKGISLIPQQKVQSVDLSGPLIELRLKDSFGPITIMAKTAILASGRFLSGGLEADISAISETLLDLPVTQPNSRDSWYRDGYMDPHGHEIHRCGIEVDEQFRPLDAQGRVVDRRLFAAGIILAHQDWIRERCGAGVAIASAFRAVQGVEQVLNTSQ